MSKYSYSKLHDCWTHRPLYEERFSRSSPNHYDTNYPPWIVPINNGDLASISGLIPNTIYMLNINDLIASFLTDDKGFLYFNDQKDPLPTSCIRGCVLCPSGSYCMSYKKNSLPVCHGITPTIPCYCPIKISPSNAEDQIPYVWTFKDNKIVSTPMSIEKQLDYTPKYNFTSKSSKCPATMTLDIRNFFPGNGAYSGTPPPALGHWKTQVKVEGGAFAYTSYDMSCHCAICQNGRFEKFPKEYSGSLEMNCTSH